MPDTNPTNLDRSADDQASSFGAVRAAHHSEMVEDYVELIADLIHSYGAARPVEIAERLGVTQPTVSKNLARLKSLELIQQEPYRAITLTDKGRQLAEICRRRHRIVVEFLISIGVPPDIAEHDAEGIEHHVSDETLKVFSAHIDRS